jgi:hypothetical protein
MHPRTTSAVWALPLILGMLFPLLGSSHSRAEAAETRSAHGYAYTWDGRQWQPSQSVVTHREKQAGIALSPAQRQARMQEMQRIDRRLTQESPVIRQSLTQGSGR